MRALIIFFLGAVFSIGAGASLATRMRKALPSTPASFTTPILIQWTQVTVAAAGGTVTINPTLAGNLIVVGTSGPFASAITSITDDAAMGGNTYVSTGTLSTNAGNDCSVDIWYAKNSKVGATTITVNKSGAGSGYVWVAEFWGMDQTSPLDTSALVAATNSSANTTQTAASATTTQSAEVVFSTICTPDSVFSTNGVFSSLGRVWGNDSAYYAATSVGSYGAVWNSESTTSTSLTAGFKVGASTMTYPFTWTGGGGNSNWNTAANWQGGVVPSSASVAVFDSTCTQCNATINVDPNVLGIKLYSGYTGTITQSSGVALTLGSSGWTQAAGVFSGSNAAITINGLYTQTGGTFSAGSGAMHVHKNDATSALFTQTGGTFTSTSATLTLENNFSIGGSGTDDTYLFKRGTSATFNHGNGTINFGGNDDVNGKAQFILDVGSGANLDLYNVIVGLGGGHCCGVGHAIPSGESITVLNNFTLDVGGISGGTIANPSTWGTWYLQGPSNTFNSGNENYMSFGTVVFNGTGAQTYTCTMSSVVTGPFVTVNKALGTLTTASTNCYFAGFDLQMGSFSAPTGIFSVGWNGDGLSNNRMSSPPWNIFNIVTGTTFTANSGTVNFRGTEGGAGTGIFTITTPSLFTLYNVTVAGNSSWGQGHSITLGSLVASNNLTWTGGTLYGDWQVQGNFAYSSSLSSPDNGTATLKFTGGNAQSITRSGSGALAKGNITVDKTAGTVTQASNVTANNTGQTTTITAGAWNMAGFNLTIKALSLNSTTLTKSAGVLKVNGATIGTGALFGGTVAP